MFTLSFIHTTHYTYKRTNVEIRHFIFVKTSRSGILFLYKCRDPTSNACQNAVVLNLVFVKMARLAFLLSASYIQQVTNIYVNMLRSDILHL